MILKDPLHLHLQVFLQQIHQNDIDLLVLVNNWDSQNKNCVVLIKAP